MRVPHTPPPLPFSLALRAAARGRGALIALLLLPLSALPAVSGPNGIGGLGGLPAFLPPAVLPPAPGPGGAGDGADGGPAAAPAARAVPAMAPITTPQAAAAAVNSAGTFCRAVPQKSYTLDCLAEQLSQIAGAMEGSADLAETRAALAQASRGLTELAARNADPRQPRARISQDDSRTGRRIGSRRALIATQADPSGRLAAEAEAIVAEAETLLLRSASAQTSQRRQAFMAVAQAVGSSKTLLRAL